MATRTALLNGNVINRDTDFSKYLETVSGEGVIEGLAVSASSVAIGKCWVKCERTNGDVILALVYNNSVQEISGDGDVYVEIPQEIIDNGELGNEDGSEIAEIKVGTLPSKNALLLATITSGVVEDKRNIINKVGSLKSDIDNINDDIDDLDERVDELEAAAAIDHLEQRELVGELYSLSDILFRQKTPAYSNSIVDYNIGDINDNKQVHIQRIGSGVVSDELKLKIKKIGSPTTNLVIEVRKGTQVNVSDSEAYWYGGGDLVASGSIAYTDIDDTYSEFTIELNAEFGGTKGELLDVVVYQIDNIVNSSNYYAVACDSTQYSEGFSLVGVNGDIRTRSKLMPYCISDGFVDALLVKENNTAITHNGNVGTFAQTSTKKISIITAEAPMTVIANSIPYSLTAADSNYYSFLRGNYWINSTKYRGEASQSNYDISRSRGETGTATVNMGNIDLVAGDEFYIGFNNDMGSGTMGAFTITYQVSLKKKGEANLIPGEIKSIGQPLAAPFFGIIDDKFYLGKEVASATTGNITPGNFVGYLQIGDYKIPYYK